MSVSVTHHSHSVCMLITRHDCPLGKSREGKRPTGCQTGNPEPEVVSCKEKCTENCVCSVKFLTHLSLFP